MTVRHAIELDVVMFIIVGAIFGFLIANNLNQTQKVHTFASMPQIDDTQKIQTVDDVASAPTNIPEKQFSPKVETASQISPDGTRKLTVTTTSNKDLTNTHVFTTYDTDGSNHKSIYKMTLSYTDKISVPFNSWSPDNVYVFVEKSSSNGTSVIVMRADGQLMPGDLQVINTTEEFVSKISGYSYKETTGWASETLLIANSTNKDGSNGPSFWVEVPSKAIIQLATDFY